MPEREKALMGHKIYDPFAEDMTADRTKAHRLCKLYNDTNPFYNEKTGYVTNLEYTAPIIIKDNCWIAANVTVCGGVKIGVGSVIAAGSVVTKGIPPNSLARGVPCKVIREITEKDSIKGFIVRYPSEL